MITITITDKKDVEYCKAINDYVGMLCVATNYIDDDNFYDIVDKLVDLERKDNKSSRDQEEIIQLKNEVNKHYTIIL